MSAPDPNSLETPIGYFLDGLVRALVMLGAIPVAVAFLAFGLNGLVGAVLAHWIFYRFARQLGLDRLGSSEEAVARPKHWLFGFGMAIVFQMAIVLLCVAAAGLETLVWW